MSNPVSGEELVLNVDQDFSSRITHPLKGINNRLSNGFLRLAKRYVDGDCLSPALHLRTRANSIEFYAFLEALPSGSVTDNQAVSDFHSDHATEHSRMPYCYKPTMLADNAERMNEPQVIIPSRIRAEAVEHGLRCVGEILYFFLNTLTYKVIRTFPKGEIHTAYAATVQNGQFAGHQIESGVQVVNYLPNNDVNELGNRFSEARSHDLIPSCWVGFLDDLIWVRTNEGINFECDVIDVGLSPADL